MKEYLFLDTSALSKGGQSLIPGYDQMRPGCVVVLSGMVLKELDLQKSRRDADSSRFARETARQIEGLLRCSQRAGDSQWKLGKCSSLKLDLSSWSAGADGDQDAAIIKQAAKFAEKHKNHGEVVLVSRDRIQRIRAMAANSLAASTNRPAMKTDSATFPYLTWCEPAGAQPWATELNDWPRATAAGWSQLR